MLKIRRMQIFADIDTIVLDVLEQAPERSDLLLKSMTAIVDQHIEVRNAVLSR